MHWISHIFEAIIVFAAHLVIARLRSKLGSFLTKNSDGLLVFQRPKLSVGFGLFIMFLFLFLLLVLLIFLGFYNFGLYILYLFFILIIAAVSSIFSPEKLEIDTVARKYYYYRGWIPRTKAGQISDFSGVTVIDNPHSHVSACRLYWVSGRSMMVGTWFSGSDLTQSAMDLAQLLQQEIGTPITIQTVGQFKSTKKPG